MLLWSICVICECFIFRLAFISGFSSWLFLVYRVLISTLTIRCIFANHDCFSYVIIDVFDVLLQPPSPATRRAAAVEPTTGQSNRPIQIDRLCEIVWIKFDFGDFVFYFSNLGRAPPPQRNMMTSSGINCISKWFLFWQASFCDLIWYFENTKLLFCFVRIVPDHW